MIGILLFLSAFEVYLPHESWIDNQFDELRLRTQPAHVVFPSTEPHPVSELLEYINTSTPKDRTAYLLKERIGKHLEGFQGFGGSLEFRSDSISRGFFIPHFGTRLNGTEIFLEVALKAGNSNEYPNSAWEDFAAGDYTRAYLKTDVNRFSFLFGRESLGWGASPISSLFLSGDSPPFDMVHASYKTDRLQFSSFFTCLDARADTSRYLTGHRMEVALLPRLFVGLNEIVLHGGCDCLPDPYYLNPLVVFYPGEWNEGRAKANILWGTDFSYFGSGWGAYGELMIDDYPYEVTPMNEHAKLGWILGFRILDLLREGEYVVAEYVGVHRWCYNHTIPWQRYIYKEYPIGHPLGNDFDRISVTTTEHLGNSFDLEISGNYTRKGEGKVTALYPEERFPDAYFLTGVVEKRLGLSIGMRCMTSSLWTIELKGGWEQIDNYEHQQGASHNQPSINFRIAKPL